MLLVQIQKGPIFVNVTNPYFMGVDLIVIITIHVIFNPVTNFQCVLLMMRTLRALAAHAMK